MLEVHEDLKRAYAGGAIGVLIVSGAEAPADPGLLDREKTALEESLRKTFGMYDRAALAALEPIAAYVDYYRKFKKTYHVLLQLESVVFKGKAIPKVSPFVEIMFMAELKNQLLTAGHDFAALEFPLKADLANGGESYTTMGGQDKEAAPGDMTIADGRGIISSIVYGPDSRTRMTDATRKAVYTVYAPPGIRTGLLRDHFADIKRCASTAFPGARTEFEEIFGF